MTKIDYYFSLNSPWSFMGSARLAEMAAKNGATVNAVPVNLGAVFAETGGLPLPKRSPERQAYRMMELKRWRAFNDIPLVLEPAHFPHDESEGVRLVFAARQAGGDAHRLATELGHMLWVEDRDPADASVQNEAAQRVGLDADALRSTLSAEESQTQWNKETEDAIANGIFAAPSYVIDGEIFWGQDRLDFVERKLKG
ncbi:MAG: 2-hydroxychromene-2-carboxylate isomerase [Hyphomicrobiaceae bacterium]|nr:2-hydroxychromene-2-carboxylate isomerase [Hyphomicrobiaceae bacterium]